MFGGTGNEGAWGFAALAQGVRGLGLGPNNVGHSGKPVSDFGGWRGKADDEPDSPEGKGAAAPDDDVPVVDEAQEVVMMPRTIVEDDGIIFSPNAISSPNKRVRRFSTIESSIGGVLRAPHRQLARAVRGSHFGFPTDARSSPRRSLDSSLGGVVVPSTPSSHQIDSSTHSHQIDFRAELISLLDNQIREKLDALECPVCLSPASTPIYACPESHIICSNCLPRLAQCGVCRVDLRSIQAGQSLVKRHRYAERMEEEVVKLREKRRGLGIDPEVQANLGPAIGVEEDEEDIVLEHKTIKKTQVE